MRGRAGLALAIAAALTLSAAGLAACFPDYGFGGADAGGADSAVGAEASGGDSGNAADSTMGSDVMGDSASQGDSTTGDSGSTGTDTGTRTDSGSATDTGVPGDSGVVFVSIAGGTFFFQASDWDGGGGQGALHDASATLDYTLAIMKTEVTVGQFQAWLDQGMPVPGAGAPLDSKYPMMVWDSSWNASATNLGYADAQAPACNGPVGKGPTYGQGNPDYPMSCTTWMQSLAFCAWLGARLPTDTEWRIVATGEGTELTYPWGAATPDCPYAIFDKGGTFCNWPKPAGSTSLGVTKDGVFDIVGSLSEWIWDFVPQGSTYVYPGAAGLDYAGPDADALYGRQWFGGDYSVTEPSLLSTQPGQTSGDPMENFDNTGWRCAKSL